MQILFFQITVYSHHFVHINCSRFYLMCLIISVFSENIVGLHKSMSDLFEFYEKIVTLFFTFSKNEKKKTMNKKKTSVIYFLIPANQYFFLLDIRIAKSMFLLLA